jgi:hypothetical protein
MVSFAGAYLLCPVKNTFLCAGDGNQCDFTAQDCQGCGG